jgi:hypothetical protein
MKTKILTLTVALLLTGGTWLRAQQGDEGSTGAASGSDESKTAMVEQCRHICAIQYNPESPGSLLAWKQELNLTEDQAASLRTVEEKAMGDAKALLTAEQLGKLKELAQNMKPHSMMQCMQGMMHGMHGVKGKMGDAMSMCCSPMEGKTEE